MAFSDILNNLIPKVFQDGYLLKQESDFKMLLEKELLDYFGHDCVTTEYEFVFTKENHENAQADIVIWDSENKKQIKYALEVKYHLKSGYDIHGAKISDNGIGTSLFETDLKKISDIKNKKGANYAYALYVTDQDSWADSIFNDASNKDYSMKRLTNHVVKNGNGVDTKSTLYFVLAIK